MALALGAHSRTPPRRPIYIFKMPNGVDSDIAVSLRRNDSDGSGTGSDGSRVGSDIAALLRRIDSDGSGKGSDVSQVDSDIAVSLRRNGSDGSRVRSGIAVSLRRVIPMSHGRAPAHQFY